MKMSLPKKIFFFRETPISPWVSFRAKFRPLGQLFGPSRPLAYSLYQGSNTMNPDQSNLGSYCLQYWVDERADGVCREWWDKYQLLKN